VRLWSPHSASHPLRGRPGPVSDRRLTPPRLDARIVLDNGLIDRVELTWVIGIATPTIPAAVLDARTNQCVPRLALWSLGAGILTGVQKYRHPGGGAHLDRPGLSAQYQGTNRRLADRDTAPHGAFLTGAHIADGHVVQAQDAYVTATIPENLGACAARPPAN